jgi:DNA-binding NtrC family response regulator
MERRHMQHFKQILVVEDDRCLETFITRVLNAVEPHSIIDWATSAEEALDRIVLKEQSGPLARYDLVLADIILDTKYTGLDLLNICQNKHLKSPFLMMSGMPSDAFLRAVGSWKKCPPYLQKPFSIRECKEVIDHAIHLGEAL